MNIKSIPNGQEEKKTKLSELNAGSVFRFPSCTFEEAVTGGIHGHTFYMVVEVTPKKTGRVSCVSVDGKSGIERDDDFLVVEHKAEICVKPAEFIEKK